MAALPVIYSRAIRHNAWEHSRVAFEVFSVSINTQSDKRGRRSKGS